MCIDSQSYSEYGVKQSGILCNGIDAYGEVGFSLSAKGSGERTKKSTRLDSLDPMQSTHQ